MIRALEHAAEPDLLVDLHWTPAQCRMLAGESVESLATLDGIRRKPHAKHRRARSGWGSLTATEIKIAAFVEEGCPTRKSPPGCCYPGGPSRPTSPNILKKLDVHSRIDIARESALRTIAPR